MDSHATILFYCISPVQSGGADVMLACKDAPTFGTTSDIETEQYAAESEKPGMI